MATLDVVIVLSAVLAASSFMLLRVRRTLRGHGKCDGCAGCGPASTCPSKANADLVELRIPTRERQP